MPDAIFSALFGALIFALLLFTFTTIFTAMSSYGLSTCVNCTLNRKAPANHLLQTCHWIKAFQCRPVNRMDIGWQSLSSNVLIGERTRLRYAACFISIRRTTLTGSVRPTRATYIQ
jgi:hypothetical protein